MSTSNSKIHYLWESSLESFLIPSVLLSLRSMWLLKQLSGVAVSRRGILQPVSIETHSSSWALLPTYPLCHLTSLSSHPWPIGASELRWNGHRVDPLGLLLSLQPLREIKPTWVCFLSVCPPIWLSAPPLSVCFFFHDRNVCWITCCTSSSRLCCGIWCNALPWKLGLLCLSSVWAGHMLVVAR